MALWPEMLLCKMYRMGITVLENSNTHMIHRRIYGHMALWPEMLLCKMYRMGITVLE